MIKPRGTERAVAVTNDISHYDPRVDDARTPMMNGKTLEAKV